MKRWAWLLAAPLLVGCSQVNALQQVSGVPLSTVKIAADDVLVDKDVKILSSPVCTEGDGKFTCTGTTLDNEPIDVTVPDDETQVMTITVGGQEIFKGPVQEVIEKARGANVMSVVEKQYGWSVAGTGLAKMWRGFVPFVVISLVNAVVQASLLSLPIFWSAWAISAAVLLVAFALMAHIADRSVTASSGIGDLRAVQLARFAVWVIGWTIVINIGLAFYFWPGIVLLAMTPFVPVAAAAGAPNPLVANFAAIRSHPLRYVLTTLLSLIVILVVWLIVGLNAFFIRGWIASFSSWLIVGFVAAWLLTSWSALFRSTPAGAASGE